MTDIALTKVNETSSKITFSYPKVGGAEGYRYFVNGNPVSRTLNPDDLEVTFGKVAGATYRVVPLDVSERADGFVWPAPTTPPPSTGFASPLGFISSRAPGFFPPSNIDKYGTISSEGPAPASFRGTNIVYRTAITCRDGYTNITEQECLANGWALHDAAGNVLQNGGYGGALGDVGNPGYRQRWIEASLQYAAAHRSGGFFIDDSTPQVTDFYGGSYPVERPSLDAYKQAMVGFMKAVKDAMAAAGKVNATYNTAISSDDDASKTKAWWQQCGPHVGGLSPEYWLTRNGSDVSRVGQEWWNRWDEWRSTHGLARQLGVRFEPTAYGLSVAGGDHGQTYVLCSYLLDWQPGGGSLLWSNPDSGTTTDPWSVTYARAAGLGAPSGAATKSGNVWSRQFANGRVTVDPVAGTASIG